MEFGVAAAALTCASGNCGSRAALIVVNRLSPVCSTVDAGDTDVAPAAVASGCTLCAGINASSSIVFTGIGGLVLVCWPLPIASCSANKAAGLEFTVRNGETICSAAEFTKASSLVTKVCPEKYQFVVY